MSKATRKEAEPLCSIDFIPQTDISGLVPLLPLLASTLNQLKNQYI